MKRSYFLIGIISLFLLKANNLTAQTGQVYVTNNGQVDLVINSTRIPAEPMLPKAYPVNVVKNYLIIKLPQNNESFAQKVKLLESDIGKTIKVGGYYHPVQRRYLAYILRSDKTPILVCLKKLKRRLGIPQPL